jgi:hypothetical protein
MIFVTRRDQRNGRDAMVIARIASGSRCPVF